MSDKKKYDSRVCMTVHNAYVAMDVNKIKEGFCKFKIVLTSRQEKHADTWVEVTVSDYWQDKAAYLKKGDVVSIDRAKLATRNYEGKNGPGLSVELYDAELELSPALWAAIKERGWMPGQGAKSEASATTAKASVAKAPKAPKPIVIDDSDLE